MTGSRALLLLALLSACERVDPQPHDLQRAQFGVFFGGEVQELSNIPLESDQVGQTIGIRLTFKTAPNPPLKVHWELSRPRKTMPEAKKRDAGSADAEAPVAPKPSESLVEFGDAMTRAGETVLDVPLRLRPGDPLGDWSVKAEIQGQQVLNRPFRVVKATPLRKAADDE
jgi:hypothetical protein